jgi:hypothetical protein
MRSGISRSLGFGAIILLAQGAQAQLLDWHPYRCQFSSAVQEKPTAGSIVFDGDDVLSLTGRDLMRYWNLSAFSPTLRRSAPARLTLRTSDRLISVWLYRLFPSLLGAAIIF